MHCGEENNDWDGEFNPVGSYILNQKSRPVEEGIPLLNNLFPSGVSYEDLMKKINTKYAVIKNDNFDKAQPQEK